MNCLELSKLLTDYFDESMKIFISEDEEDSRFCILVKLECL